MSPGSNSKTVAITPNHAKQTMKVLTQHMNMTHNTAQKTRAGSSQSSGSECGWQGAPLTITTTYAKVDVVVVIA